MTLNLDASFDRPVVELDDFFAGCSGLIDTGALFPVWTKKRDFFEAIFPEAVLVEHNREFSGFGSKAYGDLYKIDFVMKDFVYPQMPIVVCPNDKIPGYFLLSATMFSRMDYSIKNSTKEFILEPIDNQKCFNITIGDNVLTQ